MLDNPKTIWILLAELAKHQDDLGSMANSERANRLKLATNYLRLPPIKYEILENAKESDLEPFCNSFYLHLPPDEKSGLPILRASFDKQGDHSVFRIKVAILVEDEEIGTDENIQKSHRGIGIRFESPEGPTGDSNHDYYHAQWFSSFRKGQDPLPGCPEWLPAVHPAIPIPAENAVDILCCALKSFYGSRKSEPLKWLADKAIRDRTLHPEAKKRIEHWVNSTQISLTFP